MRALLFVACLAVGAAVVSAQTPPGGPDPQQPANPIIGIYTDPLADGCGSPPPGVEATACVESFYVRWLQASGIRVVPFPWNATEPEMLWLAKRVNGVLFPGGGIGGELMTEYFAGVQRLFNRAVEWNRNGDPFFLWGTCMGFQVLCAAAAGGDLGVIEGGYPGMEPLMMPLDFTAEAPNSRMFGDATCPSEIRKILKGSNSTLNWHQAIVKPSMFTSHPKLGEHFEPLSTNVPPFNTSTTFVSAVEGKNGLNVFAAQFHAERPPYEFSNGGIGHTWEDIAVSQYLANFIASRLKLNNHSFASAAEAEAYRIDQYPLQDQGWGHRTYWVPK